jgi:hypothetical protein
MTAPRTEFEQKFTEVLTSRAVAAPHGAMGTLDPHSGRRPERDGRSPPRRQPRDLSPGTGGLSRRPGELRQQLESHHTAQPSRGTKPASRGTKPASRRTEDGPSQPPADTIRGGEGHATAIVRGRYRSVCHRCSRSSPGVDPELLEQLSAENTARLAPSLARPGRLRSGAIARSTSKSIPVPALCRPPTSHWRAGARVDVGRPHQRLDQPLRGNSPTSGLALRLVVWCRFVAHAPPLPAPTTG